MLMENTAQFEDPTQLLSVFDLKGSLVDRKEKGATKPSTTLKDQNFIAMQEQQSRQRRSNKSQSIIDLNPETKRKILSSIRSDIDFLKGLNLMDYSLLICIEKKRLDSESKRAARFSINSNLASR